MTCVDLSLGLYPSCGFISYCLSARAVPKQLASKGNVDQKVLSKTPSHAVKVLGREHSPDEKMCSKRRASRHDERDADGNEEGLKGDVLHKGITTPLVVLAKQ